MSERERWIVYPLLFLALGAALRDKLLKQTSAEQIVCKRLILVDSENRPAAVMLGESNMSLSRDEFNMARSGGARIVAGSIYSGLIDSETLAQRGQRVVTQPTGAATKPGTLRLPVQELLRIFPQLRSFLSKNIPVGPSTGQTEVAPGPSPPTEGPVLQPPQAEPRPSE